MNIQKKKKKKKKNSRSYECNFLLKIEKTYERYSFGFFFFFFSKLIINNK